MPLNRRKLRLSRKKKNTRRRSVRRQRGGGFLSFLNKKKNGPQVVQDAIVEPQVVQDAKKMLIDNFIGDIRDKANNNYGSYTKELNGFKFIFGEASSAKDDKGTYVDGTYILVSKGDTMGLFYAVNPKEVKEALSEVLTNA
jgi:hypothetical protein